MEYSQCLVVVPRQDYLSLDGVLGRKEVHVAFIRSVRRIKAVSAFVDKLLRSRCGLLQIPPPVMSVKLYSMVFPESAFEKTEPGFKGQCAPLGYPVQVLAGTEVLDGIVYILYHLLHHIFPGIPRFVQVRIIGSELLVIPWHIPEPLHLIKIEICPEEPRQRVVLYTDLLILAVHGIFKQGIHITQVAPAPAPAGSRDYPQARDLIGKLVLGICVGIVRIKGRGREHSVKLVAECLQFFFT